MPKYLRIIPTLITAAVAVVVVLPALHQPDPAESQTLDEFLSTLEQRGGQVVRCAHAVCRDVLTGREMGHDVDGLYLTYPGEHVSEVELKRQSDTLQRLLGTGRLHES